MTHADLVTVAAAWLTRKGCNVVLTERCARGGETPDAIGWFCEGFRSIVIECKVSVDDFRRDKRKMWRRANPEYGTVFPAMGERRWYLAPSGLLAAEALPVHWGLLEWTGKIVKVAKPAPTLAVNQRDVRSEAALLLSELRIYHAQGIQYRKGADRWQPSIIEVLP